MNGSKVSKFDFHTKSEAIQRDSQQLKSQASSSLLNTVEHIFFHIFCDLAASERLSSRLLASALPATRMLRQSQRRDISLSCLSSCGLD